MYSENNKNEDKKIKNKNIEKWANSFSGCDGGDINSSVWLCGIEWGYSGVTDNDREKYYKEELPTWIKRGEEKQNTSYDFFEDKDEQGNEYPFNLAFKKIYSSIQKDLNFPNKIFKLNLSPVPFNKDDNELWTQNIIDATGLATKNDFMKYIISLHRFSKIRQKKTPKLIVCIGVSRKEEFLHTFFGENDLNLKQEIIKPHINEKSQNNRYIHYVKSDNTLLVVLPFSTCANGCLNSDYLLEKAGKKIIELLNH